MPRSKFRSPASGSAPSDPAPSISIPSRVPSDIDTDIPLSLIDQAPWNSSFKTPIHGAYRKGLESNLDHWGNRDRIIVWPRDDASGRYYVLDGNQRHTVLMDQYIDESIRSFDANISSDAAVSAWRSHPDNAATLESFRLAASSILIPCTILTEVSPGVPMVRSDAELFSASFNRNHSRYDEAGLTQFYRERILARAASLSESVRSRIKSIIRPEVPMAAPPAPADAAPSFVPPGSFTPTESEPWGPPPAVPVSSPAVPAFIPLVFSVTAESARVIESSILRSKSRLFREGRLVAALSHLEQILQSGDLDATIESVVAETALIHLHTKIREKEVINT